MSALDDPNPTRQSVAGDVSARIAEVVEAELRVQLAEARRRVDDIAEDRLRQLRTLTDDLVDRAERLRRDVDDLSAAIRRASADLDRSGAEQPVAPVTAVSGAPVPQPAAPPDAPPAPQAAQAAVAAPPAEAPPPAPDNGQAGAEPSDAARLVAVEMALAGSSRDDVDRHLRSAFRMSDTRALLDDVFGA